MINCNDITCVNNNPEMEGVCDECKDNKISYEYVYAIKDSLWAMIKAKMFIKEEEGLIINRMIIEEIMDELDTEIAIQEGKEYFKDPNFKLPTKEEREKWAKEFDLPTHDCEERDCETHEGGACVMTEEESNEKF